MRNTCGEMSPLFCYRQRRTDRIGYSRKLDGNAVRIATHVRRYRGSLNNISGAKYDLEREGDPY